MPLISLASPTCPYCDSQDVFPVGVDTASKGRAKKNRVWECRACGKRAITTGWSIGTVGAAGVADGGAATASVEERASRGRTIQRILGP